MMPTPFIHLIIEKDGKGRTIAHWAALSGQHDPLNWIETNCTSLLWKKDHIGNTIAFSAMQNGHIETLDWIKDNKNPRINQLIVEKNSDEPICSSGICALQ